MNYTVKLSSKNQITLPVDLLKNIQAKSGDILTMSLKNNSQVVIESLSNIKRRAMEHLSIMNPYNLGKEKIDSLNDLFDRKRLRRYRVKNYLNIRFE